MCTKMYVQHSSEEHNESSGSESGGSNITQWSGQPQRSTKQVESCPPTFRALINRVSTFSGASDFVAWLDDFVESTHDCGWDDNNRANWFSWFLAGPAKVSWQHTLKPAEKITMETNDRNVQRRVWYSTRSLYGLSCCHELSYEHFDSAKVLLTAMREHQ